MNLLCPNCQKMLTVAEQYAGQTMKCPLCAGTFNVPALAPATPPVSPPPSPAESPSPVPTPAAQAGTEVYKLVDPPPPPPTPAPALAELETTLSPPPRPAAPAVKEPIVKEPEPSRPRPKEPIPSPPPAPPLASGYRHTRTIWLSPRVVPWIAPAALTLVVVLLFLPWIGTYFLDDPTQPVTQSGWGTGFGTFWSVVGTFHVLLLLLTLLLAFALVIVPWQKLALPPQVKGIWPHRFLVAAGLTATVLLLLVVQLVIGFGLERTVERAIEAAQQKQEKPAEDRVSKGVADGAKAAAFARLTTYRTMWVWLTVLLHVVAVVAVGLHYWLEERGRLPVPRADLLW